MSSPAQRRRVDSSMWTWSSTNGLIWSAHQASKLLGAKLPVHLGGSADLLRRQWRISDMRRVTLHGRIRGRRTPWTLRTSWSRHGRAAVFKRVRDSPFAAAPTWSFGMTAFYVIQDHPAYIPCGQRWPLRPELAALLGFWPSSQLARCAGGRAGWRQYGDVAVLPCCTVYRVRGGPSN